MKRLLLLFVLMFVFSCTDYIDKPERLVSEETMAEILAELSINDQASVNFQNTNMEAGTRYVLKTYQVKPADFTESFKYYVLKQKMKGITEEAQKLLLKKDPKAEKYIQDKTKNNGVTPPNLEN